MSRPRDFQDVRWQRLAEADAAGDPLGRIDREFLVGYLPKGIDVRAERSMRCALAAMGDVGSSGAAADPSARFAGRDPRDGDDDDALIDSVVDAFLGEVDAANGSPADLLPVAGSGLRWWTTGVGVAAVVGWLTVGWLYFSPESTSSIAPAVQVSRIGPVPSAPADAAVAPRGAAAPREELDDGDAVPVVAAAWVPGDGFRRMAAPDSANGDAVFEATTDGACVTSGASTACFRKGTRLRTSQEDMLAVVELLDGEGQVELQTADVVVRVAGDNYQLGRERSKASVAVELRPSYRWEVNVAAGEVAYGRGEQHTLKSGQKRSWNRRRGDAADRTSSALLGKARSLRASGDRRGAIEAYASIVQRHRGTPAARTSMVALGQLNLDIDRAHTALRWFDRYLSGGRGPLSQEAYIGRIRALRSLGRGREAEAATDAFLAKYPGSGYASKLRGRESRD